MSSFISWCGNALSKLTGWIKGAAQNLWDLANGMREFSDPKDTLSTTSIGKTANALSDAFNNTILKNAGVKLPKLASGGVVRGATQAIIGESGAEAVVPLERNTEWIDILAEKLSKQMGGGVTVNQTNNYSQEHSRYEILKSQQDTVRAVKLALAGGAL